MRSRRTPLVLLGAALAALALAQLSAAQSIGITEAGGARFPDRAYVLRLPSGLALTPSQIELTENGIPIKDMTLTPAGQAGKGQFALVLALDASNSMRGRPIEAAMEAARSFAARRNPDQQLAVVTFNTRSVVLLPFTTDADRIAAALATPPPLENRTKMYDGVGAALDLVEEAGIGSASVVVLSDGADTGSRLDQKSAAAIARSAHVRLFTVGLRSPRFKAAGLEDLAALSGGTYTEANSAEELEAIYAALAAELASEYLLRYRSRAGPSTEVRVRMTVAGLPGNAQAGYVTPSLPEAGPGAPFHRAATETFWRSTAALAAFSLVPALLLAAASFVLLRPRTPGLRRRMAEFISIPLAGRRTNSALTDRVFDGTEKPLSRLRWWTSFKADLELAEIRMPAVQVALWTLVITIVAMGVLVAIGGSPLFALLALAVPLFVRAMIKRRVERRRRLFAEQLPDNLQVLASALRAGHSFIGALSVVIEDAADPARKEFKRIIGDEQLGSPLDEALLQAAHRMASRDLEQVALVAALQRESGGNAAEVLDRVAETVRERFELRRLVKTLTAQGRMARWIVSSLPVALLVFLTIINPAYMNVLYTHPLGRALLVGGAVMVTMGSLLIKRIVNIKV